MAQRHCRSLLSILCLSFVLCNLIAAHPNARNVRRQSLELTIEKWEDTSKTLNSSVTTDSVSDEINQLPKSLKDFLQLLGWGLKLFGDALASLLESQVPAGGTATGALLTDVLSLATLVPYVPTTAWQNTSRPAPTSVIKLNSTSFLTVKTTRVFTVTAPRTSHLTPFSAYATPSAFATSSPLALKQSTLPFERQSIIQVYAGRYPGIARTITDLESFCASLDIDIITLAGVTTYFAEGSPRPLPIADFDSLCNDTLSLLPSGTGDCAVLSTALRECQTTHGKKLFLAIEAGTDTTTLRSAREATTLASVLWDTFGAGRSTASGARKYGGPPANALGIAFDGFEFLVNTTTIDDQYFAAVAKAKRDSSIFIPPTLPYFDVLFNALRELFTTGDRSKPYYLSVSLPCTRPSIISRPALELADFVSVRFMDDVACNVNGLAFSNFLRTWGSDLADHSPADRVGLWQGRDEAAGEGVVVLEGVENGETGVRSLPRTRSGDPPSVSVPSAIDPARFSIPRYTTQTVAQPLSLDTWPSLPDKAQAKRHDSSTPHFLLGIPVPSLETQNATAQSGVGSADPVTLANIVQHAKGAVPGFAGVLLWGGVRDLEVGEGSGYLGLVKGVLDGTGPLVAVAGPPAPSLSSVVETTSVRVIEAASVPPSAAGLALVEASGKASVAPEEAVFSVLPVFEPVAASSAPLAASAQASASMTVVSAINLPAPAATSAGGGIITIKSTRTLTTTILHSASSVAAPSAT